MMRRVAPIAGLVLLVLAALPISAALRGVPTVAPPPAEAEADLIRVRKSLRTLTLMRGDTVLKTYRVALGFGGLDAKTREGDGKVPEGRYRIVGRNPDSTYHLSLRIGYPLPEQVEAARNRGEEPGGDIMIHGLRNGFGWIGGLHRWFDWTAGCIAVTDAEIEEIWQAVPDGTPIEIVR